ncbi:family 20 glycosylhydrolase, partial [bacterium]|nr:family 20 glycosylhydrolase [bacterium]
MSTVADVSQFLLREPMFQPPDLIPAPCSCLPGTGKFRITSSTQIHIGNKAATASAELLQQTLVQEMGIELRLDSAAVVKGSALVLQLRSDRNLPVEGYQLTVLPEAVTLRASDPRGLARGVQSLRQLLLLSAKPELASLQIQDHPRYPYRGMHLDVSRHFYSKEFILKYIDLLALYGFNTFHWHLVDDNGWRIEINRYPLLTEIGSRRADRTGIHWLERAPRQPGEATTYGGFYTQTEVREIVAYAQQRQITIIPEIEMPGHTMAALAAYPEYSCTGGPFEVCTGAYWPVTDIFCAGNDSTFTFLEHILLEVMELFPGEYIHIGGDEADKTEWKRCPRCQARMAEEGLKDEAG